jgi:hypothetical protein
MRTMMMFAGLVAAAVVAGCGSQGCAAGTTLTGIELQISQGDAVVAPIIGNVCSIAEKLDPTSPYITLTCDVLDTAGNVIGQLTQKLPAAQANAIMAKHAKKPAAPAASAAK